MRKDLVSQAERICDEAGKDPIGVIVQATGADEGIADVDPGRLRAVTRLSLTGVVRPNRTHSVGDSSPRDHKAE